jgi:hypothetical protein
VRRCFHCQPPVRAVSVSSTRRQPERMVAPATISASLGIRESSQTDRPHLGRKKGGPREPQNMLQLGDGASRTRTGDLPLSQAVAYLTRTTSGFAKGVVSLWRAKETLGRAHHPVCYSDTPPLLQMSLRCKGVPRRCRREKKIRSKVRRRGRDQRVRATCQILANALRARVVKWLGSRPPVDRAGAWPAGGPSRLGRPLSQGAL